MRIRITDNIFMFFNNLVVKIKSNKGFSFPLTLCNTLKTTTM